MEQCDVLIVGGGPAGSSCAWGLRHAGIDVIVFDKAQFPRHKVCAGWITPPIVDELELDVTDYQQERVLQPITSFITGVIGGKEIETAYGRIVSYGIRRCEFDDYLLRRSEARLRLGEPFRTLRQEGGGWILNETIRAPIIVGAGGHFCPIARWLESSATVPESNGAPTELPVVVAQEVEFEMSAAQQAACAIQPERPELFFCSDLRGYGWAFRKGNYLNLGLGREAEANLSTHVAAFVDFMRSRGKFSFELSERFRGHAYRLRTRRPAPPTVEGALIIGDALGLADKQSGEGIRPAIESGLLAAQSVLEAGGRRSDLATMYAAKLQARFGGGTKSATPAGWLPLSLRQFAARRLMASRWFTRRVLLDQWFLHLDEPLLNAGPSTRRSPTLAVNETRPRTS